MFDGTNSKPKFKAKTAYETSDVSKDPNTRSSGNGAGSPASIASL
jgi:hypothetical protein